VKEGNRSSWHGRIMSTCKAQRQNYLVKEGG
jgi:hypothetical protein